MHEILFISLLTRSQCTPFSRIKDFFFYISSCLKKRTIRQFSPIFFAFEHLRSRLLLRIIDSSRVGFLCFYLLLRNGLLSAYECLRRNRSSILATKKSGITKKNSATRFFDTSTCKKQKLPEIMTITLSLPHNWRAAKQFENTIRAYQEIQNGAQFLGFLFVTPRNLSVFFAGLFWQTSSELTSFQGS